MDEARQRALELANVPGHETEWIVERASAFYAFLMDADSGSVDG